jgi:hypothetical protein
LRTSRVYEVHDEHGVLRKFWFKDEAERFAGDEFKIVETKEPRYSKPHFNLDLLPDAPF